MSKEINAYRLGDRIFIHAKKDTQSVPAFSEPLYELKISDSPILIGEKVRECIEAFQEGSERYTREDWKKANDPIIRLSGVKNSNTFFKNVLNVPVNLKENSLVFFPTINSGKEGLKWTEHPNIELDYTIANDEDLGKALLKAFELSSIV